MTSKTEKDLKIREALAHHIKLKYPNDSLNSIAQKISMTPSDVSRVLNLRLLPSLQKILDIEVVLGMSVINANYPGATHGLKSIHDRLARIEKALNIDIDIEKEDQTFVENQQPNQGKLYSQIIADDNFSMDFDTLLTRMRKEFKQFETEREEFQIRKKDQYISFNLASVTNKTESRHIMMCRYSKSRHRLSFELITSHGSDFEKFVVESANSEVKMANKHEVGILLINDSKLPIELHAKPVNPVLVINRQLTERAIELIVKSALWVFNHP